MKCSLLWRKMVEAKSSLPFSSVLVPSPLSPGGGGIFRMNFYRSHREMTGVSFSSSLGMEGGLFLCGMTAMDWGSDMSPVVSLERADKVMVLPPLLVFELLAREVKAVRKQSLLVGDMAWKSKVLKTVAPCEGQCGDCDRDTWTCSVHMRKDLGYLGFALLFEF